MKYLFEHLWAKSKVRSFLCYSALFSFLFSNVETNILLQVSANYAFLSMRIRQVSENQRKDKILKQTHRKVNLTISAIPQPATFLGVSLYRRLPRVFRLSSIFHRISIQKLKFIATQFQHTLSLMNCVSFFTTFITLEALCSRRALSFLFILLRPLSHDKSLLSPIRKCGDPTISAGISRVLPCRKILLLHV